MIRYLSSWGICLIVLQILGISRGWSARLCLSTLPTHMTDGKHIIRLKIANQSTLPNCQRAIRAKTWGWRGGSRKEPRKTWQKAENSRSSFKKCNPYFVTRNLMKCRFPWDQWGDNYQPIKRRYLVQGLALNVVPFFFKKCKISHKLPVFII